MGLDYALVISSTSCLYFYQSITDHSHSHLKYTIPPGIALTLLCRPFFQRIDLYKIVFLISVAVISATPWDSYLIRNQIWTYHRQAVLGLHLFLIPIEEIFFFIIQTYNTSVLYILLSKPIFHPSFLDQASTSRKILGRFVQIVIGLCFILSVPLCRSGESTYLALILLWAMPFILLLWTLSSQFLVKLPLVNTLVPIALPTLYLWVVDTLALKRGTWIIEPKTKLGIYVWDGLEIEEATFFLLTNILVVFGLVAFDHSLAIIQSFPDLFPNPQLPSPALLIRALLTPKSELDQERIKAINDAVKRLRQKSRSFYLASATFSGRLRIDLILLYSFCRVADDLVDNAGTEIEARKWISKLTKFLDLSYADDQSDLSEKLHRIESYISDNFPKSTRSALQLLPTRYLSCRPLYELLEGFKTDVEFLKARNGNFAESFPIKDEQHLNLYATRVAGTIAELCLELVFHHGTTKIAPAQRNILFDAGRRMGVALQYVNISRDIEIDAGIKRVYLPTLWAKEVHSSPEHILKQPFGSAVEKMRTKLLDKAFTIYETTRCDMAKLPAEARAPLRVAVDSYMEIGRVIREKNYQLKKGRATVPMGRRLKVAWKSMMEP
ncbi:hypothetical protein Golomagni_05220 [Golovinomyces magnicellulatus]|nr:hypothetical protein Golomagni_05220 [Golovinomyces magnicellulatus]